MQKANDQVPSDPPRTVVSLLFLLSGTAGLVYEVLWMRRATTIFGASAPATAATFSAFFLGLAVGSSLLGRLAPRLSRPLSAWGLLEIGIGIGALLVDPLLDLARHLGQAGLLDLGGLAAKTLLALAAFLLPSICMGGTLPLLGEALGGRVVPALYALNTLGGAAGALLVPLVLLPWLGSADAARATAGVSVLIGIAALAADRRRPPRSPRDPAAAAPAPSPDLLVLAFLSGLLVLGLETLAVRMLALVHENSIHAFALVVATFLLGLALGAWLGRRLLATARPRRALALVWSGAGLLVVATPPLFFALSHGMRYIAAPGALNPRLLGLAAVVLVPIAVLAGAVLPVLLGLAAAGGGSGDSLGRVLAASTLGAIAGPLLASFVLSPRLGLWGAIGAVGLGMLGAAAGASGSRRWILLPIGVALLVIVLDPYDLPRVRLRPDRGERIVSLREGYFGTVAAIEDADGDRRIKLDNFYILGGTASLADERLQGHLPLLLHPHPRRVAFLGLGTGVSAGAALLHPLEAITAVELVPEVAAVARTDFAAANLGIGSAPRSTVIVDDARSWLARSAPRFDVIVGDLFVPWRPGESALYTAEAFAAARHALAPGGLFCQWVPLYQLGGEELRILIATFLDVFPKATLWRGDFAPDGPALMLAGEGQGYVLDPDTTDRSARTLAPALQASAPLLAAPGGIWLHLVAALDPADPRLLDARRNRDGSPWLELLSPAGHAAERAAGGEPPGARLERFVSGLPASRAEARLAGRIGPDRQALSAAGRALGQAAVAAAQGHADAANTLASDALAGLPEETRAAIAVELEAGAAKH